MIRNHGFNIVAVEADWPDAARIDRYVRHHTPEPSREQAFARFPSWMWRNQEVLEFADWLRAENEGRPEAARVEFRGLDIYSLQTSMAAVLAYLDRIDPGAAREARTRYGCLTPWQGDPAQYGHYAVMGGESCEKEVSEQLVALLQQRLAYAAHDGETFFNATQNARIVRAAEQYYRTMYRGSRESWNLRDRHMFDTLQTLIHRRPKAKTIVWAHNSHVGDARATEMSERGEFNLGQLIRERHEMDTYLIGFSTYAGTVTAASNWDAPAECKTVMPGLVGSYEDLFHQLNYQQFSLDLRNNEKLRYYLQIPRLYRAIGVIYRPETERDSHYFFTRLPFQYDSIIHLDNTTAVQPLDA